MTLTVTFDLFQGQICCRAGDHNSLNLLVGILKVISCLILIHISPQNGKEYTKKNTGKIFIFIYYFSFALGLRFCLFFKLI